MQRLLFLVSEDSYFYTHRLSLALSAKEAGFDVFVASRYSKYQALIESKGIKTIPLHNFSRTKLNPIQELRCLLELYQIYRHIRPTVVHHVAIKPVLYGTLIARICKVPRIINALGGLGYLFTSSAADTGFSWKRLKKMLLKQDVCMLFRLSFNVPNLTLILQNPDDAHTLLSNRCITKDRLELIRGVGVNTSDFLVTPPPPAPPVIITLVARMLWDKGIGELVEAARLLKSSDLAFQIHLYGLPDPENPSSITEAQLIAWTKEGLIQWHGFKEEIATVYGQCHIAVLPSYREGLPKSLLEAAACGRPIVATDVPGCREVVQHFVNGLLVPSKDPRALAEALQMLIENEPLRLQMGHSSRNLVEENFKASTIHRQTIALYQMPS